jgi:lipid A ethanolaminephosphotransferase
LPSWNDWGARVAGLVAKLCLEIRKHPMGKRRYSPETVTVALAAFTAVVLNYPFWRLFFRTVEPGSAFEWLFAAATLIVLFLAVHLALTLIAFRSTFRVVNALLLPISAAASFFMLEYGVVIDANMVQNIFETNPAEASDLMSGKLVAYTAALGILPAILVWYLPIGWRPLRIEAKQKLKILAVSLPLALAVAFPFSSNFISVFREHRELKLTLLPLNYLTAVRKYLGTSPIQANVAVKPYGDDAARVTTAGGSASKSLFVIVVGETARADHFSLNGYARPTNPELAKVPELVNYAQAYSCGTDTAQSVPCMFSGLGRAHFSNSAAAGQENLLDILQRVGVDVVWRDNQAGCKGVCARVLTENLTSHSSPEFSSHEENHDEILIDGLKQRIGALGRDTVIVLHMMGSHGPAYWKRVPERFEVFKPICAESQFSRCENQAIVNAYDNTILYTDFVLARLIDILKAGDQQGVETAMIYMSDHGESLGEKNMFLHGMPYAIAPEAQRHVPAVTWISDKFRASRSIDLGCMKTNAAGPISHDNLFHSVLGGMGITTRVYDPVLDLFSACRPDQGKSAGMNRAAPL